MNALKKYLNQYTSPRILDIGSGKGDFINLIDYIYQDYQEIIGIDIVDYLLEMDASAFKHNPKIKWMDLDVLETTFPKHSFDIISLSNTLHHIKDIKSIFSQMADLLKPNGMIVVSELMIDNDLSEKQKSHRLIHGFAAKLDEVYKQFHAPIFTQSDIYQMIEENASLPIADHWQLKTTPFEQEIALEEIFKLIDGALYKVKDHDNYVGLEKEANEIKSHIKEHGFGFSATLCVILKR